MKEPIFKTMDKKKMKRTLEKDSFLSLLWECVKQVLQNMDRITRGEILWSTCRVVLPFFVNKIKKVCLFLH